MPGWHEATAELREQGEVETVGIIQEQHPDRARLFMQWKRMAWPIMVDSYDLLEVPYVPITVAVDEHGTIRRVQPRLREDGSLPPSFVEEFVNRDFPRPEDPPAPGGPADLDRRRERAESRGTARAWRRYGDGAAVWGGDDGVGRAIEAYRRAVELDADDRWAHFRLGVAYRKRHDSGRRRDGDFKRAVHHWSRALELEPNQYIYRRRIQQYGPRLDKPYPFYDWIRKAREEIRDRGGEPASLRVEPRGSEFAHPAEELRAGGGGEAAPEEPDPAGQILRDDGEFVEIRTTAVPPAVGPGETTRIHVALEPVESRESHWNNEAGPLMLWVEPPGGWTAGRRLLRRPPRRDTAVSGETRHLEVEVRAPEGGSPGTVPITGYALYYVCEDIDGVCMFRRQDLAARVEVEAR